MDQTNNIQRFHPTIENGLSSLQVEQRINQGLSNKQPEDMTKSTWRIIKENVFTLFNLFNLLIGIALFAVGSYKNMLYLLVITFNICIGIAQELHARKMVRKLSLLSIPQVEVIRDGKAQIIGVNDLVLDDICLLKAGGQICADSTIISGEIEVDESQLTGEADSIYKTGQDSLFSGSYIISGQCYAKVNHIGEDNFAMQVTQAAKAYKPLNSELNTAYQKVFRFTSFIIVPVALLLFFQAFFVRKELFSESIVNTSAALLGMLPKGLMLLTSISLALSVVRLAKKKILVQELYSIETLAHVDVLCLDKTGTLTQGHMQLEEMIPANPSAYSYEQCEEMICAFLSAAKDNNATNIALKEAFPQSSNCSAQKRIAFSSARKWSAAKFDIFDWIILGAPDILLKNCSFTLPENIHKTSRVLLLAKTSNSPEISGEIFGVEPLAWLVLNDPIRKDVKETLQFFHNEGLQIKIISGDNPETVWAIAHEAGLENPGSWLDAQTLADNEDAYEEAVKHYTVFGLVKPDQKQKIIKALHRLGHKVAMTGDGVNDVLALKEADCSVAMASGSDAAKQISQIVLLDSNFSALPHVLMEGRRVVNNITRVASIFFTKTVYAMLLSIVSILTNTLYPFIPIQITLLDAALEGYPSFLLAFEPDKNKIKGSFLFNVFSRCIPAGLLIVLGILLVQILSPIMQIPQLEATTLMYYLTGLSTVVMIFRACKPLNLFRAFICSSSAIGFFIAAILFKSLLHLGTLSTKSLPIFIIWALINYPLSIGISWLIERITKNAGILIKKAKKQ